MKLVVEDDKDTSCNGNGILEDPIKKMISSEPPKVSSNGDVHNDDSRSNSDSLNGSGDLLVEDPNAIRNGSDDTPFQNGNKADDTRSWSSNSSNFPPPDIDEELSDEMTLRLSDEDDESENTPESIENKKDNIQHTSSPLPIAEQNTLSDKNQIAKLVEDDAIQTNTEQKPTDNVSNKEEETKTKSPELESLISEIIPDTSVVDTADNNKSVTELREEMEELLNDDDSEDNIQVEGKDNSIDNKVLPDVDLNSSTSTIDISFSNEEGSSDLTKENEIDSTSIIKENDPKTTDNDSEKNEDTNKDTATKTNENIEIKESKDDENKESKETSSDDSSLNKDQVEAEDKSDDIPKVDENIEDSNINSDKNDEESNKDLAVDSTKSSDETNTTDKSVSAKDNSVCVSDNISEEVKNSAPQAETEAIVTVNDDSNVNLKDNDENNKKSNNDEAISAIPELMEVESNSEKTVVDQLESVTANPLNAIANDSEAMEVDIEKDTDTSSNNTVAEEPTKNNYSTQIVIEENKSEDLIDTKDNILNQIENEGLTSESAEKADIKEEIQGKTDEEITKSLKRTLETDVNEKDAKKPKIATKPREKREYVPMNYLRDFLTKKEIKTLSREELEEICVQKMCESINQTSKVGALNRLVKQQEQVIESLRTKYNGLKKQIGDISIVQNKMLQEVRAAKGKDGGTANVMPVKITRSVGLQVSLATSNRIRPVPPSPEQLVAAAPIHKRKMQRISLPNKLPNAQTPVTPITPAKPVSATIPKSPSILPVATSAPTLAPATASTANKIVKTILPRTYSGPDSNKDVSSSTNNSLLSNYLSSPTTKPSTPNIVRKTMTPTNVVSSSATTTTATSTKVIDLTDEDDVSKTTSAIPAASAGIRVVAPHQLNNTSATATSQMQRLTYLVSPGQQGQVLLATTTAPTRPGGARSTIMFKPVQQGQLPNGQRLNLVRPHSSGGTVTVLPATSTASIRPGHQIRFQTSGTTVNSVRPQMISSTRITPTQRHPAPLPGPPAVQPSQPTWKAMPPKPSLKISRAGDGIVLSWKMLNKDMSLYEEIASYQLYAYQETNALPSTDMWRKVGDVKALALPMACTLTQFTDGNKYHFAVRAVDVKSRVGPFSQPEQIALP